MEMLNLVGLRRV